jgi:lipid II:glycine glycyltransferase (peptidoglycan interpeptide bridge formation enzyme)
MEYQNFIDRCERVNYLQDPRMDMISNDNKHEVVKYVAVFDDGVAIAGARLLGVRNRLGYYYFFSPRGYVADYHDAELIAFFTKSIKKYLKKAKAYMLMIEPYVMHVERDGLGKAIPNGINNESVTDELKSLGYKHEGYTVGYDFSKEVRWLYVLDLAGKSKEDVLRDMRYATRRQIRETTQYGVYVEKLNYSELDEFYDIFVDTADRRQFVPRSKDYFEKLYKSFGDDVFFLVARIKLSIYEQWAQQEIVITKDEDHVRKMKADIVTVQNLRKKYGETLNLSSAMFLIYKGEVNYLSSGSYEEFMMFYGQYAIQWYMISYALEHKIKLYNFQGFDGNFDRKNENYGLVTFKSGFGAKVLELIGDFDLPINYLYYLLTLKKQLTKFKR